MQLEELYAHIYYLKCRSFEPAVNHYFSSNNVRFLAHVFTGEDRQTE